MATVVASPAAAQQPERLEAPIEKEAGRVTILRDEWGTPHIYAAREEDGYFGWGYAAAEDRLPSLLRRYLAVQGRLAATFGADQPALVQGALAFPGTMLDSDLLNLRWRHWEEGKAGYARMEPAVRRNYRQYVAGIERFMLDHPEAVPAWAPRVLDPALPVALTRAWFFSWAMGQQGIRDCQAGGVEVSAGVRREFAGDPAGLPASNAWVLMPWRTSFNALVHLSDSHGPWAGPGEMYMLRIHAGPVDFLGSGVLGVPFTLVGHSSSLAWTTTDARHDVADCYEIETDAAHPRRYRYDGSWKNLVVTKVAVALKEGESAKREFEYARLNGVLCPVVARSGSRAYAVCTPYMDQAGRLDEQVYHQQLARSVDEYWEVNRRVSLWPGNQMVGDARGNALYVRAGRVPVRSNGFDWTRPLPGNTSATAWRGIHARDDLIHLRNPLQGYMQNNNIAPDMMVEGSPIRSEDYPAWIFSDVPGRSNTRGYRAVDLLSRTYAATVDDVKRIALDQSWFGTGLWLEALRQALSAAPAEVAEEPESVRRLAHRLLAFDGVAGAESMAALAYERWRISIGLVDSAGHAALSDAIEGVSRETRPDPRGVAGPPRSLTAEQQRVLRAAVERAAADMVAEYGSIDVRYGDVFRVGRGDVSWPVGGGGIATSAREVAPLGVAWFSRDTMVKSLLDLPAAPAVALWLVYGQRMPLLTIFTDPIQSFTWVAVGQSGDPRSPHYADQARLMSERTLRPTWFSEQDLLPHVASRLTLDSQTKPRRSH